MKFLKSLFAYLTCGFILLAFLSPSFIRAEDKILPPRREELAWLEIPEVITPARKLQPISESPSSVSVITASEIRRSGLTTIPDILRRLAGVDVMATSPSDINVGIRGSNSLASNKILVMIDGRSVYMDFYGTTFWSSLPILLEEIERIEVVRGPASVLYGANAFSGVINIITKTPAQLEGTHLAASAGTKGTYRGTAIHAGRRGDLSYKLAVGWKEEGFWEDDQEKSLENLIFNSAAIYHLGDKRNLNFSAGINSGKDDLMISKIMGRAKIDGYASYLKAGYSQPDLTLFYYWNRGYGKPDFRENNHKTNILYNTHHLELQNSLNPIPNHSLTWGGSYRFNTIKSSDLDHGHYQSLSALFLQDDFELFKNLNSILGCRYDYNSLLNNQQFSPRGSLIYQLNPDHSLRFSVSKAHREPTFLESYIDFKGIIDPSSPHIILSSIGNENLKPEKVVSYELGWMANLTSFWKSHINLFDNEINDLIEGRVVSVYPFPPYPPREITFTNSNHKVRAIGGEAGIEYRIINSLTGYLNYSYQELKDTETHKLIRSAPKNKVNAGLHASPPGGFSLTLNAHYVDKTYWDSLGVEEKIDDYILVSTRLAYTPPRSDLEAALSVFNLFNDKHREHPLGEKIGQRILFTLRYSF